MKMDVLMENWRRYSQEPLISESAITPQKSEELLEEGMAEFMKNLAMFAGAAGLGVSLATVGFDALHTPSPADSPVSAMDDGYTKLTDAPSFGTVKKPSKVKMDASLDWQRAPTGGNYAWVPPETIEGHTNLPMSSVSADDYRKYLMQEHWSIEALHSLLFKTSSQWAYGESMTTPFDIHPEMNAKMLPPDWSIAYDVYREKVTKTVDAVERELEASSDEGDIMIAKKLGTNSVEELRTKLDYLTKTIE